MSNKLLKLIKVIFFTVCYVCISASINSVVYAYPSNSVVRVAIMDDKYTTVEKTDITMYATSEMILTDMKTNEEIGRIPEGAELSVCRSDGKYSLYYIEPLTELEMGAEFDNDFKLTCPCGVIGIKNLIRGGKPAMYRGELRFVGCPNKSDKFYLINCLDVEYYLKGVVPCEMPVNFGLEALKAQAVAARVYSLTPRKKVSGQYDVVDSVASQVYNGYNRESEISNQAIESTHGLVALHDDNMIVAVFCSTAGGYIESYSNTFSDSDTGQFPSKNKEYLIAKPDLPEIKPLNNEEDAYIFYSSKPLTYDVLSPLYRWTRTWSKDELQRILESTLITQSKTGFVSPKLLNSDDFGTIKDIKVSKRGDSGKIIYLDIVTDKNIFTVSKELVIRRVFQKDGKPLPSANAVFKFDNVSSDEENDWDTVTVYGGGYGHGCGLSQFGARYMAQKCNASFDTILNHYYNNIVLGTKPVIIGDKKITQCFYQPFKKAVIVIPDKKDLKSLTVCINDNELKLNLGSNRRAEIDISGYINANELNNIVIYPVVKHGIHSHGKKQISNVKLYIRVDRN